MPKGPSMCCFSPYLPRIAELISIIVFDGAKMPGVPANVVATRNLEDHIQLRKPWTKGLSSASIKEYIPTIIRRELQLAEELEKYSSKNKEIDPRDSVDLAMWMSRFAFDFMGDMA